LSVVEKLAAARMGEERRGRVKRREEGVASGRRAAWTWDDAVGAGRVDADGAKCPQSERNRAARVLGSPGHYYLLVVPDRW